MRLFALLVFLTPFSLWAQEAQPACGNGVVEPGEACDDGNLSDADGCRNDCRLPACGDGLISFGEVCDDGNAVAGDGCEPGCKASGRPPGWSAEGAPPEARRRSPGLAFALSLGGTVAGTVLLASSEETSPATVLGAVGFLVAPSFGQLYTGHRRHALITTGIRAGALTLALAGLTDGLSGLFGIEGNDAERGFSLFLLSGYVLFGVAAYDIIDAPFSARRANRGEAPALSLLPAPLALPGGQAGLGLSLSARF